MPEALPRQEAASHPDADALVARRGGRLAVVAVLATLAAVLVVHSVHFSLAHWPFSGISYSDGSLLGVLEQKTQPRLITFYIGLASRDAAGGRILGLAGPRNLNDLAKVEGAGTIATYSGYFLQQMSGWGLEQFEYDPTLSDEVLAGLLGRHRTVEYPMSVVGVVSDRPDGRVVLFTDERREKVYCVPAVLVPEGAGP
ncbi:MAG: hypothetical protein IBX62_09970 [Coriobacteriia bacterium]|nr:hypothetical protein [Coriobacteriia bacterium]